MEEDIEIELLYERNKNILMKAAAGVENENDDPGKSKETSSGTPSQHNQSVEETLDRERPYVETFSLNQGTETMCSDDSDIQDLIDTQLLTYKMERKNVKQRRALDSYEDSLSSSESDDSSDDRSKGRDDFISEMLGVDEQTFHAQNTSEVRETQFANHSKDMISKAILELISIQKVISKRDSLMEKLERKLYEDLAYNEEQERQILQKLNQLSLLDSRRQRRAPSFIRFPFKKFGIPYFHDKSNFPPPPNIDVVTKRQNGELNMTNVPKTKHWTKIQKDILQDAIQNTLVKEKSEKFVNEITKLREMLEQVDDEIKEHQIIGKITQNQAQLQQIKQMSYLNLLAEQNPNREYDWLKYSATSFNGIHSEAECRRFWHLYLKPSINKSSWTSEEDSKLKKIAEEMNYQDWDTIAKKLGNSRSGYQCFVQYQTRLCTKLDFLSGKWTKEEDEKLLSLIKSYKIGDFIPWTKISSRMGDRTHNQIYSRYVNCLNPNLVKGRFSKEEDLLIVSGVEVFGVTFKEIASLMTNRTHKQVCNRYERHLLPKSGGNLGTFSREEDEQLLRLLEVYSNDENKFALIAAEMKTRTRTQLRQRYNFIKKLKAKNPNWSPAVARYINLHKRTKKIVKKTQKDVQKCKKEIDHVIQTFKLTELEVQTFRIEKLKELRDNLFRKKLDIKPHKRKVLLEHAHINKQLLDFFRNSKGNCPLQVKFGCNRDYRAYLNEISVLSNYFGQDFNLPDSEDEILQNDRISYDLKLFLIENLNMKRNESVKPKNLELPNPTLANKCSKIDYVPGKINDTFYMDDSWYDSAVNISNLNFSEFFKRTVFDYSSGMHQDIWNSIKVKPRETNCRPKYYSIVAQHPENQKSFIPPNILTTLGYKSLKLSRTRLRRDARMEEICKSEFPVNKSKSTLISGLKEQFLETLNSLFYCPRVLSITDFASTPIIPIDISLKPKITENLENNVNLLDSSNEKIADIVSKVSIPLSDNALQSKKMKQMILEQNKDRIRQMREFKKGISYQRKMEIEHLVETRGKKSNKSSLKKWRDIKNKAQKIRQIKNRFKVVNRKNSVVKTKLSSSHTKLVNRKGHVKKDVQQSSADEDDRFFNDPFSVECPRPVITYSRNCQTSQRDDVSENYEPAFKMSRLLRAEGTSFST